MNDDLDPSPPSPTGASAPRTSAIEESFLKKSDFLSSVGHEIRGPLSSILAQVEMLQDGLYGALDEGQKKVLDSMQENAAEAIHLLATWIELQSLESGETSLSPSACLLRDVCEEGIRCLPKSLDSREAHFVVDIEPAGLRVTADACRLMQMIVEFAGAAVLSLPTRSRIYLNASHFDGCLRLTASTSREAGLNAPPSGSAPPSGFGSPHFDRLRKQRPIGMALLEKLVVIMGGSLACTRQSEPDFNLCLSLPLAQGEAAQTTAIASPPVTGTTPSATSGSPVTILIADDQTTLVSVVRNYLESLGFGVITARDGKEALLQVSTHRPQLVLMDVRMPVLDGLEAIRQIRESADTAIRATVIIGLSGLSGAADKEKCLAAGANAYLSKPFGIKELDDVIDRFIYTRSERSSS